MRILLVGEYSRLHNSLKEGLQQLGHEVVLMGAGDGFKNYPVDIFITHSYKSWFLRKFRTLIFKITGKDLGSIEIYKKVKKRFEELKGFDVVQLINETSIKTKPKFELEFLKHIIRHNDKLILLSCGVDHVYMKHMMAEIPRYSLMTPYLNDNSLKKTYQFQLSYLSPERTELHEFIIDHCQGVIATDMDYHLAYKERSKYLGLIPNPVNVEKLKFQPFETNGPVHIFHGINRIAQHKKGNSYFSEALKRLKSKFGDRVQITEVESLPYDEYIKAYDQCHILLDQVYSYDQGYNALEAMAKGKVVFTGAEQEWLEYYDLEPDTVVINATPDVDQIYDKLEWLVEHPEQIELISRNARNFIEQQHHYQNIARRYLSKWESAHSRIQPTEA